MNYIDYVLLAIILFFVVKGLFRGLIHEVLGFLGLTFSLVVSTKYTSDVAILLKQLIEIPPALTTALAFIFLFIATQLCVQILSHILQKAVQLTFMLWLEKLAGGLVGLLKGGIVASLLALLISIVPLSGKLLPEQDQSILIDPLKGFAPNTFDLLMRVAPNSKSFYEELKESIENFSDSSVRKQTQHFLHDIRSEESDRKQNDR